MNEMLARVVAAAALAVSTAASAGLLDNAWIKCTTDKDPVSYRVGEKMKFTLTPMGVEGEVPEGEYSVKFKRSDDFGNFEEKTLPFDGKPFVYETSMSRPGFVRIEAFVVDKAGKRVKKQFTGDATTPEGRKAMNKFEKAKKDVFFDGGAGADVDKLVPPEEPGDFDAFWKKQFARLDSVPVRFLEKVEVPQKNPKARVYAVSIACAEGIRPVTGYLSIPVAVDEGKKFPARLETHGYGGNPGFHMPPERGRDGEIVLNINAHGMKLPAFGATDDDLAELKKSIKSNGKTYAFDPVQNANPEAAYFNGMVLRVKRGLQCLKKLKGWNGKDLYASGGSQGGLQTIWAAGCGEGVTRANSDITWCCDMPMNEPRLAKKASTAGWYIPWVPALGYYDAANWAKRIPTTCRTSITRAGLGDYTCPPTGLAKMYNNIPGDNKSIRWVQGSEHGYVPPEYPGRDFMHGKK
ncbi:MAG: acetylxylan esterase [Kiritimatiellae bacterium]|nr:acetylxylan esterase [Kiritimatiellia bacterium]